MSGNKAAMSELQKLMRLNQLFIRVVIKGLDFENGKVQVEIPARLYKLNELEAEEIRYEYIDALHRTPVCVGQEEQIRNELESLPDALLIANKLDSIREEIDALAEGEDVDPLDQDGEKKPDDEIARERREKGEKLKLDVTERTKRELQALFDRSGLNEVQIAENRRRMIDETAARTVRKLRGGQHFTGIWILKTLALAVRQDIAPEPGLSKPPRIFKSAEEVAELDDKTRRFLWDEYSNLDSVAASEAEAKK